ncbi:MAG: aspartyl/asparaginyl beta-hydroxylase domain-containing protein [Rubrivivax sp.]|nr:aspartyl/asparaginyl beta-hydroxylase domain-containing protein [Rubrivivax sp.]
MADPFILRALNGAFYRASGGERRPAFFDIDATYPALRLLDRHQDEIRAEMEPLLAERHRLPKYHEVDRIQADISGEGDAAKAWRVFMLKWPAGGVEDNRARCPRTAALLDRVPGVVSAFFSVLEPGKSVPAHDGPYLGYLRYHLALKVPARNPPSIRIKDRTHTWVEGGSILFDDSWNHEVFNQSDETRVVLIVDVLRPMPWPYHVVNWIALRLLGPISDEARTAARNIRRYSRATPPAASGS